MHDGAGIVDLWGGLAEGRLEGFSPAGWPLVAVPGEGVAEARALVALGDGDVGRAVAVGRLGGAPLVVGLIRPPLRAPVAEADATVLEAPGRLELRCGRASVTLFADGRVEVRGTEVLSRADGTNRVQGGSVQLN